MSAFIRTCVTVGAWLILFAGGVAAAIAATTAFVLNRAEREPVDLYRLLPAVEWAVARSSDGVGRTDIGEMLLSRDPGHGRISLSFSDFVAFEPSGAEIARFAHMRVSFEPSDLLALRFGPRDLVLSKARLRIVRSAERLYALDYGPDWRGRSNVFQTLTGGRFLRGAFERASLADLEVEFLDEATGQAWTARGAEGAIERTAKGYDVSLSGAFDLHGVASNIEMGFEVDLEARRVDARLDVAAAPLGDIAEVFLGPQPARLTSLVSGVADVTFSFDGRTIRSRIDGEAGEGRLSFAASPAKSIELKSAALSMYFDAGAGPSGSFVIERASAKSDLVDFALSATIAQDLDGRIRFGATVGEASVPSATGGERLVISNGEIGGSIEPSRRRIDLSRVAAEVFGERFAGAIQIAALPGVSPGVNGNFEASGQLSQAEVLSLWPAGAAASARKFVVDRVAGANFSDLRARIDLAPGALDGEGSMPDEALDLSFSVYDASISYVPGMQPIDQLVGDGRLGGNSFFLAARGGRVGDVRLLSGSASIPRFSPKGEPTSFEFVIEGDAGNILGILDDEPLNVLADTPFDADQFEGVGVVRAKIIRPNLAAAPPESYQYEAKATFDDLAVRDLFRGASLVSGAAAVNLDTDGMRIEGAGTLNGAPLAIDWRQRFRGDGDRAVIAVEGEFGPPLADLFGVSVRQYIAGKAPFTIEARGDLGAFKSIDVDVDLTDASMVVDLVDWLKPPGAAFRLGAEIKMHEAGAARAVLSGSGTDLVIDGAIETGADGALISMAFNRIALGDVADFAVSAFRSESGGYVANLVGRKLSVSRMIEDLVSRPGGGRTGAAAPDRPSIELAARIDRLVLRGGVEFVDAGMDFSTDGPRMDGLHFTATDADGGRYTVDLVDDSQGAEEATGRIVRAYTDDIGRLSTGVFGLTSVVGGEGVIAFSLDEAADQGSAMSVARVEARNLRIRNAPLLARVFAAGSLSGLADILSGEGIAISEAVARLEFRDGGVGIEEFRAAGPSLGLTAGGAIGLGASGDVDLSGAVAPAYGLNSLLGRAPIIGDLFVNRDGEGVIALAYRVTGPPERPTVSVNPLSALTPGVFRRMFEPFDAGEGGRSPASAEDAPAPVESAPPLADVPTPDGPE